MRVLAVGSVPPPAGGHRDSLLLEVLRRREAGDVVEVASVDPSSAAHRFLSSPGIAAVIEVALLARRFESVIVQLEPGMPVRHGAGRSERAVALLGLAGALRHCGDVKIRVEHLDDLPGGPGGRAALELWKTAHVIEVPDEGMRSSLLEALGPIGDRVVIAREGDGTAELSGADAAERAERDAKSRARRLREPENWGTEGDVTAAHVIEVVRSRAAAEREALGARGRLPIPGGGTGKRVPQWQWLPAPGAGVPDLGPIKKPRDRHRDTTGSLGIGRAVRSVLAAGERHALTRPAAHLVRAALVELRSAVSGG